VLKVAPPGVAPVRNRDVLRQSRLLSRLARIGGLAVPAVYFEDDGSPPFFGMERVPGDSFEPRTDVVANPPDAAVIRRRGHAAAGMLARLHAVHLPAIGLEGEPVTPVAEEVERWSRLLATVDPDIAPGHEDVYRGLTARLPDPVPPALLHGDFRLGNIMFDGDRLTAVIDWEIWSVGDPRTDLAWLLMHANPAHRFTESADAANTQAAAGMPSASALLRSYLAVGTADMPGLEDLPWFMAYCHYKVAATLSVFVKRNRHRTEPDPAIAVAARSLPGVLSRCREILSARSAGRALSL
jgi:aminoglycoside phosphotransferase (APT) family kinase protein